MTAQILAQIARSAETCRAASMAYTDAMGEASPAELAAHRLAEIARLVAARTRHGAAVRRAIRSECDGEGISRVEVVAGDAAPRTAGESYCYRTAGGTLIEHPGAYAKRGWSNMHYSPSTRAVVVGADWVSREVLVRI